jgi:lipid II:glycine glycyltransferase (peptidoglycan interpeptide bridge formation enzyme)
MISSYRVFSRQEYSIPIFMRDWWLDATCGPDGWNAVTVETNGRVQAALPFAIRRRGPFKLLLQPPLTPFLGPWIRDIGAKSATDLARQKDLMQTLIAALPPHDHYQQNWNPSVTNWLPFYWRGFQQTTRYTYRIDDCSHVNAIWANLGNNIRREIRKAENRECLRIDAAASLDDFIALYVMTFLRQSRTPSVSPACVKAIYDACVQRNCNRIVIARDSSGRAHAGVFLVWSDNTVFYLLGGGDPSLRTSGAGAFCLWYAIKMAGEMGKSFDFEGSMIESVERFFRAFGARQTPYMTVKRSPNRLLRVGFALKSALTAS